MFGDKKAKLRLMAMEKMMKDKPAISMEKPRGDMSMDMGGDDMPEEGLITMPVTKEEREMIMSMRKSKKPSDQEESMEDEEQDY
jgi:hypothetical protein